MEEKKRSNFEIGLVRWVISHPTGLIVLVIVSWLAWLTFSTYVFDPVKESADQISSGAEKIDDALALGLIPGVCPGAVSNDGGVDGWHNASDFDEHGRVKACSSGDSKNPKPGDWLVVFDQDGNCEHGFQIDTPGATNIACSQIPGWPQ